MAKRNTNELLNTTVLAAMGTTVLVGLHHYYRRQQYPQARLQDYLSGINTQLKALPSVQVTRLQYTYQQAAQAYQSYPSKSYPSKSYPDANTDMQNERVITDFSTMHTTTMLARPVCWVSGVASMPKTLSLNDNDNDSDSENGFGVVGIDADRQVVWQTTMPERVHDIVVQPIFDPLNRAIRRDVVVMGRRPSDGFWVLDTITGQVQQAIKSASNRHFYGHACYSLDGKLLYVTENDTVSLAGKIGIYDVSQSYKKVAEFDSYGIGPHELIMHPDGETLIIANGGIKTEQASREELNLDTMRPSLVYLNIHNGSLLEQVMPEHNQMSIRHLAIHDDGTVMIGIQFQGEKHINVPLVLTHKRGDVEFSPLVMPNNQWQRFHQYIASVAVNSQRNLLCVTTPIGGCAAIFDLNTRTLINDVSLPDCAGASVLINNSGASNSMGGGFIISDGQGQLTTLTIPELQAVASDKKDMPNERIVKDSQLHKMSFDNHLQAL